MAEREKSTKIEPPGVAQTAEIAGPLAPENPARWREWRERPAQTCRMVWVEMSDGTEGASSLGEDGWELDHGLAGWVKRWRPIRADERANSTRWYQSAPSLPAARPEKTAAEEADETPDPDPPR